MKQLLLVLSAIFLGIFLYNMSKLPSHEFDMLNKNESNEDKETGLKAIMSFVAFILSILLTIYWE